MKRIYLLRLSSAALCAAACAMLIMAAFLSSGYLNALARERATRAEALALDGGTSESRELEAPIAAAREQLEAYGPLLREARVADAVAVVLAVRHPQVGLSLISYDRSAKTLRVSGVAATRESLLTFERSVRSLPQVAEVSLPVGDLARSTNAPFSLTIRFLEETP